MQQLEAAILRTLLYADIFKFALNLAEIHHYLDYQEPVSLNQIAKTLQTSTPLQQTLCFSQGYYALSKHPEWIERRIRKEELTQQLWPKAVRYGHWLAHIPFVQMVAMTGALAVHNPADEKDDFDYLLLIKPGRVWLARAGAILVVRISRLFGIDLCPNYVLGSDNLFQKHHNLFMAHEVVQTVPLFGETFYKRFRAENAWTENILPNSSTPLYGNQTRPLGRIGKAAKNVLEWLMSGAPGNRLEAWEYQRKRHRFARQIQPDSAAEIDSGKVKGHFDDHGNHILQEYQKRLKQYGLQPRTPET